MSRKTLVGSKYDIVLRIYAPRFRGFVDIESVCCFVCGRKQERIPVAGQVTGQRIVEGHHIYPASIFPDMEHEPENYIFLCTQHHREFHWKYDKIIFGIDENGNKTSKTITASIDELQEYLGLTSIYTVAKQQKWGEIEIQRMHLIRPYKVKYKPKRKKQYVAS